MKAGLTWICSNCSKAEGRQALGLSKLTRPARPFTSSSPPSLAEQDPLRKDESATKEQGKEEEQGALSRRLSEMAEETMETGGRSARKVMEEAGFSEELKKQLEERIAQSAFRAGNQQALSQANLPSSAGKGTRDQAAAQPWTGSETLHDAALRMLDDGHKRLRIPTGRPPRIPNPVSLRPAPKKSTSPGERLANARDKTSIYALSQNNEMTEEERVKMRRELKERFTPGARPMPTTLQGLTSLANERIEDAIARGQFKNIPRGKGKNVERDYNANSPFLDTTEYFMNKIIQKQEIVPPWIEKQQELVKAVSTFRARLRNDWRRHAARVIASKGGPLDDQIRRAQAYALAEAKVNPLQAKKVEFSAINSQGNLSTVTVEERSSLSTTSAQGEGFPATETLTKTIQVTETSTDPDPASPTSTTAPPPPDSTSPSPALSPPPTTPAVHTSAPESAPAPAPVAVAPMAYPFRDPDWELTESKYHTLAVENLNSLTRSYNLMAPKIAQKPYYSLSRELARCFADVAPTLPDEIAHRARTPTIKMEIINHREGGIMDKFSGTSHVAKVRDEDYVRKGYGFKQFWKDLFRKQETGE